MSCFDNFQVWFLVENGIIMRFVGPLYSRDIGVGNVEQAIAAWKFAQDVGEGGGARAGGQETWSVEEEVADWRAGAPPPSFWAPDAYSNQDELKEQIGCKLYALVHATHPAEAGKIVGMLLEGYFEIDSDYLVELINQPLELEGVINQCFQALIAANQHRERAINLLPKHVEGILMKEAERSRTIFYYFRKSLQQFRNGDVCSISGEILLESVRSTLA